MEFSDMQNSHGAVLTKDDADSIRTIEFGPDGFPVVPSFEPLGAADEAVHFGSPHKEFLRARSQAAVFDLSRRGHVEVVGADRQKFMNGFCTADVLNLKPGEGCEAFVTNIKGKVVGHVFLFAGEQSLWLETVRDSVQPLMEHLTRYVISEDVDFLPKSEEVGELLVSGPSVESILAEVIGTVPELSLYGHQDVTIGERWVSLRRVDWLDAPGYLLCLPREGLGSLWTTLVDADIRPAGIAVFHALRILAGFPLYGIDISDDNLAQEVGRTKQTINFKKGCYLGQEPIARIDALGHVNRELRTLRFESTAVPIPGAKVSNADGKEIGKVTSYAMLPDDHVPIALGYLHRGYLDSGTKVTVDCEGEAVSAAVC